MFKAKKCKNCGKEIDSKALYCMNCGVANKKSTLKLVIITFVIVCLVLFSIPVVFQLIIMSGSLNETSNETLKEEIKPEWKQNSNGWTYTENNVNVIGWKEIDGTWYYFESNGYMVHDETIDNCYLSSDGSKIDTLTLKQAEERVFNQVKKVRYSDSDVKLGIAYETEEKTIEGKEGYFIRVSEDRTDHYTTPNNIFIDKHTGKLFDASELFSITGDCKLQEFKKSHESRQLTEEGMINAENNPLYDDTTKSTKKNTNNSNGSLTSSEAKNLILQEDSNFIESIKKRDGNIKLTTPTINNKNQTEKIWNLPEDEYYESSLFGSKDEEESCNYLVGKKSKNVYAAPHQGGEPIYQIKNNQKVNTYYCPEGDTYEWR